MFLRDRIKYIFVVNTLILINGTEVEISRILIEDRQCLVY